MTSEEMLKKTLTYFQTQHPYLPLAKQYNGKWSYDFGVVLQGFIDCYKREKDPKLLNYIQESMDYFVTEQGEIMHYDFYAMSLDNLNNGKILLFLYQEMGAFKYKKACDLLMKQLKEQPRTKEGGFWHKKIYPHQMWLDGLYMAQPFYAAYDITFNEGRNLADVTLQFELCFRYLREVKTGLYYHGWDSKKVQNWANFKTGLSKNFWGRAMGWYAAALVDTIKVIPHIYPERHVLQEILTDLLKALVKFRDKTTHTWYQVVDRSTRHGNYTEASCSSLLTYAYAKAYELGVLGEKWGDFIKESYNGLCQDFVFFNDSDELLLIKNCEVAGLGGTNLRDASFAYYISEPIISNDFKGLGAFLQASCAFQTITENRKGQYVDELFYS